MTQINSNIGSCEISKNIFNVEKTDYEVPSLFLGEQFGLVDSVNRHYPELFNLYKKLKDQDWDENEFDFTSCLTDFKVADKDTAEAMITTLAWQWEGDTIAARTVFAVTAPFLSAEVMNFGLQRIGDNECLVEGTEVLTPTGWLDLRYVTLDTKVAQYNPNDESIQFVNPSNIIEKKYKGIVYDYRSNQGHYHQTVTPKHRMLAVNKMKQDFVVETAESFDFQKGATCNLISGINSGIKSDGKLSFGLSPIEKLYVAIQADGYVSNRYDGSISGTIPVWFTFAKERKINRLIKICLDCNINIRELTGTLEKGNIKARRNFKIDMPIIHSEYLKNFKWVNLIEKDKNWCIDFLKETIQWDGYFCKNTGILVTTSREAAEVTQAVASLVGMKTHLSYRPDNRKESFSGCWRVSWKNTNYTSGQTIYKTSKEYDGKVRCLTVPTGFFMIRYNNSVSITGNCLHALTYSEIVKNSFENSDTVIKKILADQEALKRVSIVTEIFNETYITGHKLALGLVERDQETYNVIFLFFVAMYCLERIQFVNSFTITFAIARTGIFVPIGEAVKKICNDEFNIHAVFARTVLDIESKTKRGQIAFTMLKDRIQLLLDTVVETERRWTYEHLFANGKELTGLNADVIFQNCLYNAAPVYNFFGLESKYDLPTSNNLKFLDNWIKIDKSQESPQEGRGGRYFLGGFGNDHAAANFDHIEL